MRFSKILLAALVVLPISASAQRAPQRPNINFPEYEFTVVKENAITPIKNQANSGTCWCYSAISFLESEAIRINGITDEAAYPDFAEMFIVSHSYQDRADKFVRLDGKLNFGQGSECEDVIHVMKDYGLVPQEVQEGLNYGTPLNAHGEMEAGLIAYLESVVKSRQLTTGWKNAFKGIVDAYLGECPEEFEYNGKTYTPAEYRDSFNLNPDDYVSLTSFTHHPFYEKFAIEVCDNWRYDQAYNVPLDELMDALYYALEHGYTTTWGGDVSEIGFNREGLGILVDQDALPKAPTAGSDEQRWVGGPDAAPGAGPAPRPQEAVKELAVTQESRQAEFDNHKTSDDHGMHAFGVATDQFGNKYVMIKNSWGDSGKYHGIWYLSDAFTRGKMIDFMVHKDGLPKELKKKLGIE